MADLPHNAHVICFGTFEADLTSGELFKSGRKLRLQEQPFQVLAALLRRPGEVITREELQKLVWPADTFVDFDRGLNRAVNKVRDVLEDSAETPRFIETVPRRGYRFIAPIRSPDPPLEQKLLPAKASRVSWAWPIGVLALLASLTAGILWWRRVAFERKMPQRFHTIAVLPLEDLSHDPAQAYFADGMTDELITELAGINALDVISRTSVQRYKGAHATLGTIAGELHADAIVEGTVLRSGNRVRVTAQLIDAKADRHLWAQSYERELGDVLWLQQQVAQDIAVHVSAKLTPREQRSLAKSHPLNPEAWDNYLRGRFFWNERTAKASEDAIRCFNRAISLEPGFAQPYAGLADTYFVLSWDLGIVKPEDGFPKGKAAALKALALDPTLGEAHASLAWEELLYEWDWAAAEREARSAIQFSPSYATAHHHYSRFLALMGRFDEARVETIRTLQLEPMDPIAGGNYAWNSYLARRYDESIKQSLVLIQMFPSMDGFRYFAGWDYEAQGRYAEAIQAIGASAILNPSPQGIAQLGYAYAIAGQRTKASASLEQLQALLSRRYVPPYYLALVYIGLGDTDRAFEWLERAYKERSPYMVDLKTSPQLDRLRRDPRFSDLMRRVGF